ncbi:sortase domain-containing protein [Terrihabitans sp. B22-R8]|uniref:sortase domain-containing protein n=1 Tax=Terrihabitans sp. B22-R8 TaxID=3425128 RepID=UPI00403D3B2C
MSAPSLTDNEGRALGRVLRQALFLAICVAGIVLIARGAMIPAKAFLAQILLDRAFERSVIEQRPVKPWSWADMAPLARVSVSRLGVSQVILSGGSDQAMAFGPTQLPTPATGGRVSVLAAHRDTHFAFLADAKMGDVIDMEPVAAPSSRYRIVRFEVVHRDRFAFPRDPAAPLLALTTCYPFGTDEQGPWRLVAWAERMV